MAHRYIPALLFALCVVNYTYAETIALCSAENIILCNNYGFTTCKKVDTTEMCFCGQNNTRTSAADVLAKDLTCGKDSGKWHDPYHWFTDISAATFLATLLFGVITTVYGVLTYAKSRALYWELTPEAVLHYIPLLSNNHHRVGNIELGNVSGRGRLNK